MRPKVCIECAIWNSFLANWFILKIKMKYFKSCSLILNIIYLIKNNGHSDMLIWYMSYYYQCRKQFLLLKGELWSILTLSSFFCTFGVLPVQTKMSKISVAYTVLSSF